MLFVKENLDRKKKSWTLEIKQMQDESNFHEPFGHTLRCATGGKVKGGDACILWIDVPDYVSNDGNSSNQSSF